jgi:threonine/homoserine/homoserine lactone efflux protein
LLKSAGNEDVAEYFAITLMSVLIGLNTFTLFSIVYIVTGVSVDISKAPQLISGLLFFGLLILFYILLVRKNKHLEIVKEYEQETSKKKIIGTALTISYILISIGLLMFCMYLMMQRNRGLI